MITRTRRILLPGNFEQGKEYEVVVAARNKSGFAKGYEDSPKKTIYIQGKTDDTGAPSGLLANGGVQKVALSWENPGDYDFDYVEIWVASTDDRRAASKVGIVRGDSWIHEVGAGGETRYYWIRAVNTSDQRSAFYPNSLTGGVSASTTAIEASEIEDFSVTASKIYAKIPILDGDNWSDNSPGAGSVAWNAHTLVYNGTAYSITAGDTSNKYIYWDLSDSSTTYQSSGTAPSMQDDRFIIAMNNGGSHNVAWNSIANQVIGSAYILDAAITSAKIDNLAVIEAKIADLAVTDAKINDLSANKLTAGTIDASVITVNNLDASNITTGALDADVITISNLGLDEIDDGSTYGRVLLTDISAGHIKLSETVGDLDDVDDGTSYGKVLATDISSGHIILSETTGDLDDIDDGTSYGKVLSTDISAGHILLSSTDGDLDDIDDGTTYKKATDTQLVGASRAYAGLDASSTLTTRVKPGDNIGTPAGSGLYLGADYLGYYSGSAWDVYIDSSGNFAFKGDSDNYITWDGSNHYIRADKIELGTSTAGIGIDSDSLIYYSSGSNFCWLANSYPGQTSKAALRLANANGGQIVAGAGTVGSYGSEYSLMDDGHISVYNNSVDSTSLIYAKRNANDTTAIMASRYDGTGTGVLWQGQSSTTTVAEINSAGLGKFKNLQLLDTNAEVAAHSGVAYQTMIFDAADFKFQASNTDKITIDSSGNYDGAGYVDAAAGFKDNGTAGIDNTAAGTVTDIDVSGGIITGINRETPESDGTYQIADIQSITIADGIITAITTAP